MSLSQNKKRDKTQNKMFNKKKKEKRKKENCTTADLA